MGCSGHFYSNYLLLFLYQNKTTKIQTSHWLYRLGAGVYAWRRSYRAQLGWALQEELLGGLSVVCPVLLDSTVFVNVDFDQSSPKQSK
jgi:hypothetical protein